MLELFGIGLIVAGSAGLALVGLYSIAPGLVSRGKAPSQLRIDDRDLLAEADLTPSPRAMRPAPVHLVDSRITDEIFSELFSLRADLASITESLRALRESLAASGLLDPPPRSNAEPIPFRRAA